ncbi:MAG: hypothetical protein PHV85_10860, partial [Desulfovibrionaceae bacterium]|nr:hypothetical protein [Desulfovibrionaceae bacterium]
DTLPLSDKGIVQLSSMAPRRKARQDKKGHADLDFLFLRLRLTIDGDAAAASCGRGVSRGRLRGQ